MPKIGSIGIPELLIILVVVLLIFGPRRLPDMAKGLGQSVREFRRGLRDMRKEFDDESGEAKNGNADPDTAPPADAAKVSAATVSQAGNPTATVAPNGAATPAADVDPDVATSDENLGRKA
ncbi:MAG TPA: twin-arginine translocase TatA/TatE family subunit [Trueperaceae bacterium]|nr:twin-arginine translocase TatA/TatE family subunit [Trueperaceae bacterium]